MPKCKKETYDNKKWFCGEHQLQFKEYKNKVGVTALGLGMEACLAGYRVYFATVPSLINQLKEHRSERTLRSFELKFEKYDLVILDELGYISFDKEGAELLFSHLSLRAGRKSTIITSNLSFTQPL